MSNKVKINLLGLATIFCWSVSFPLSKVAMQHFSPYSLGFLRVCIASATLLIIGRVTGSRLPKKEDIIWLFLAGFCGFGGYLFVFNKGILTLTSASSSIIIALTPVMTAVVAHHLYKERINYLGWIMLGTAFSGVLVMMLWDGVLSINYGMFWTLGAAVLFCMYNHLNRMLVRRGYKAIEIVTYGMISASVILLPFSIKGIQEVMYASYKMIFILIALGIICSAIAYFLWSCALSMTKNTSEVTNYSFLTPLFATLLGSAILGETPNMGTVLGGAIIITSIVIFSLKGKEQI